MELDPDRLAAGEWMEATASGYTAGEQVQVVLYPGAVVIGSVGADVAGFISTRVQVPDDFRPGSHTIEATGWQSEYAANADFTVVTSPVGAETGLPFMWWLIILLALLAITVVVVLVYFRRSIFGGRAGVER